MLNFTEHMKRIIQLAEQSLVHVQSENFGMATDDLMKIGVNCNEAMQQLDEFSLLKHQGKNPAEKIT